MAVPDQSPVDEPLRETTVIDCDVHVMRPEGVQKHKAEYISMPYRTQVDPEVTGLTAGYPTHGHVISAPGRNEEYTTTESNGIDDPETELREGLLEAHHVDVPIINMGPLGIDELLERDRRSQEMRATNNTLLDLFLDPNDDFLGLASISTARPDEAAEEIDRLADEDQIVGLYATVSHTDPPLGDPKYDVMYEAAEDHGLPFVLHSADDSVYLPRLNSSLGSYLESHTIGHPTTHTIALASMVYQGVPAKFPDLEFVSMGAGVGWVAGLLGRMNREYERRTFDAPLLEKPPSEYVRDSWYFGTQPLDAHVDPSHTRALLDVVGADSMVFGSNYPLYDAETPTEVAEHFEHFSQADREKLFAGNAIDVFDLDGRI